MEIYIWNVYFKKNTTLKLYLFLTDFQREGHRSHEHKEGIKAGLEVEEWEDISKSLNCNFLDRMGTEE